VPLLLQPFTFTHVATGTLTQAVKGTQLYRANPAGNDQIPIDVGDAYTYEIEGKRSSMDRYLVEVVAIANGNDTNYVPRCISGNMGEHNEVSCKHYQCPTTHSEGS
jgi:hypothetical protein